MQKAKGIKLKFSNMPPSYDNLNDNIRNPFNPTSNVTPNFGALAKEFLPPEDAERFRKLEENPTSHVARPASTQPNMGDLEGFNLESGMTADERAKFREAKELRETRNRLIKWVEEFNIGDEEWVNETFTFLSDGSAICKGDLYLSGRGITYFPKGVKKVHGHLDLSDNQITKIENLPASVGGSLYLSGNQITKIENLPKSVDGILHLTGNPAKQMQAGVNIGGELYLSSDQTELIQDAKDKGYEVIIL
jgi:hypothetical protein